MGGGNAKLSAITYEEAVKRVTEAEMKRLKNAFKRTSNLNGLMTEGLFIREVLWEGVPPKFAQLIYRAFGGTPKGLSFKDLLCGLVILTRGMREEKIKLLFGMYADEAFSYIQKEEMDRRILETEQQVSQSLSELFKECDQVTYEQFSSWVSLHPDATLLTKWLLSEPLSVTLSNDMETPTFYQTLAGVTHLEETDINELEKCYWDLKEKSKSGRFDQETFKQLICPPVPDMLCEGLFLAFDENRDNHIDFKEMACGISACCRGPKTEQQKFCFKIFDTNHEGKLDKDGLKSMLEALVLIRKENNSPEELEDDVFHRLDPETVAMEILLCHDGDQDGCITMEEYLVWTVNNTLSEDLLNLLSQICHIVLGLRPLTREEEGKIVRGWLERESRKALKVGQTWYLISMAWWNSWNEYVTSEAPLSYNDIDFPISNDIKWSSIDYLGRQRIAKNNKNSLIAMEDDSVVMVNVTKVENSYTMQSMTSSLLDDHCSRSAVSLCGNARQETLNPLDMCSNTVNRSPSASPKMRKKTQVYPAPQKPGAIDNSPLVQINTSKVMTLTIEGGRLKKDVPLVRSRDFEIVPEPVWRALSSWYGGNPALPRTVITSSKGNAYSELELYPITVRLFRHQNIPQKPVQTTSTFTGMMAGISGMTFNIANFSANTPRRYLAYTAAFSRHHTLQQIYEFLCGRLRFNKEDIRLWKFKDEHNMTLLEDDCMTLEDAGVEENQQILIEVRNKDLTWPEEMCQLAKHRNFSKKDNVPTEQGATGLNNLGNTCFMNAAVQCVSNTWPLTQYFTGGLHLYELNRMNPLGMKGHIAQRYGELVKDLWSGSSKTIAPLKLRWTIGKYAPRFNGFQQQDSQELLSFLLDGLHEDLNRVHEKPYVELKDSNGRPDEEVAQEAWENHILRNQSIVVDLFHGQLKSQVRCKECGHVSVRFDPFNYLSLPLPMDSCVHLEVIVIWLDGSVPVKYGLRLNMDEKYKTLKKELSKLTDIAANQILFVEIFGSIVKTLPQDNQKVRTLLGGSLYAYELPPPASNSDTDIGSTDSSIAIITASVSTTTNSTAIPTTAGKECIGLSEIQRGLSTRRSPYHNVNKNGSNSGSLPQNNSWDPPSQNSDFSSHSCLTNGNSGSSNGHSRNPSNASSCSSSLSDSLTRSVGDVFKGFIIAVHRKMIHVDDYFLSSQKAHPDLFGTPLILPCQESTSNQNLYQFVWTQVARLVSPLPPSEAKIPNHAQDCDDSLGYEYPFTLKVVQKDGFACAWCPWYKFCRGCVIDCNTNVFNFGSSFVAIDWEPTALHLRYQTSNEKFIQEHRSVEESRRLQTEPIDLDTCLQAFTKEEELGEDELYCCSKCNKHCLASKKLDIWRLPPILIINLKRFQCLNGRWVKSHKIVKFPFKDFDPSSYIAPRARQYKKISTDHIELTNISEEDQCNRNVIKNGVTNHESSNFANESSSLPTIPTIQKEPVSNHVENCIQPCSNSDSVENSSSCKRQRVMHSNSKESMQELHKPLTNGDSFSKYIDVKEIENQSKEKNCSALSPDSDCDDNNVRYDLYAVSCHTGILGGGHYVAFAKNPNNRWYCYNDSSCKEVFWEQVDGNSAYILFYERQGVKFSKFMPDVSEKEPDIQEIDDEFESEYRKI
ncbi:ubiquitin carboxyl-terminal hydrolase 32-like [Octopus vulgaris]|uniref:ubiquitinyl hydrolase 1 n=1 Tax=Octopus vulgaris TaxID=6645 RepID=A0AA36AHC4_OCTVU|nr:ubiquitin carboxyl-terminal hydrolase 32-like [Octopus vulgaris]